MPCFLVKIGKPALRGAATATARLFVHETASKYDRGDDIRNESYMAKILCTEMASRVIDRTMQILGGVGLTKELPLEYFYRQIRSLRITEGDPDTKEQ